MKQQNHLTRQELPICDGCGAQVDEAHIRRRIERLELATRFRPIPFKFCSWIPHRPRNSKIISIVRRRTRATAPRWRACSSMSWPSAPDKPGPPMPGRIHPRRFSKARILPGLRRRMSGRAPARTQEAIDRMSSTVVLRMNSSYKPKSLVPISRDLHPLLPLLQLKGWSEKMILNNGQPFDDPFLGDAQAQADSAPRSATAW